MNTAPDDSTSAIDAQRRRYDHEAEAYDFHHNDKLAQRYRTAFIRERLLPSNLAGCKALDAMCASGIETGFLIERGADVTGLDVSPENARLYERNWERTCLVASIHDTGLPAASFDLVYVFGGLHHVVPMLGAALSEIHRILKRGGHFCFVEPNRDTWPNHFRSFWYRHDERFLAEEEALSYRENLQPRLATGFAEEAVFFGGNFAYLVSMQSLILGTPQWLKRLLYRPAFAVERFGTTIPILPSLWLAARWRKL